MGNQTIDTALHSGPARLGNVVSASRRDIGEGFTSLHFSEALIGKEMAPLLMVDDFVMTAPTFAPHLHVGMSVLTALFDDARGGFVSRDTLGRNLILEAGELYWLAAAMGAVHEQRPLTGASAHGLQIFIGLPAGLKTMPARTLHVRAGDIPLREGAGYRVRVVLGASGGVCGAPGAPQEMTLLDGVLQADGRFSHDLPSGCAAWIYAVSGAVTVCIAGQRRRLEAGHALTVAAGLAADIMLASAAPAHFVLLAAPPA